MIDLSKIVSFEFRTKGKGAILALIVFLVLAMWPKHFTVDYGLKCICAFILFFPVLKCFHRQKMQKARKKETKNPQGIAFSD